MKKVLLGILTLIPVIVLLVVAMVSNIVALQAHISVEDVFLRLKSTGEDAYDISLSFDSIRQKTFSITDYIDVVVYPQRANNYTLEYELSGDILYTDVEYEDISVPSVFEQMKLLRDTCENHGRYPFSS